MRKVAVSLNRFSSGKQAEGHSFDRQIGIAKRVCQDKGWTLDLDSSVSGKGVSGYNEKTISRLLDQLKDTPDGCVIIVESIDRFSRLKPRVALRKIEEVLDTGRSIYVYEQRREYTDSSLDDDYDSLDDFLRDAHRAYRESRRKGDAVRATKQENLRKARNGGFVLTARVPYGYRVTGKPKDQDRTIQVVKDEAEVVKEIFELTSKGWGGIRIANWMNEKGIKSPSGKKWTESTVFEITKRVAYIGQFQPTESRNGKTSPVGKPILDYFPRIVPDELFNKAHATIKRNTSNANSKPNKDGSENLFTGLLQCAKCGSPIWMVDVSNGQKRTFGARAVCSHAPYKKCPYAAITKIPLEVFLVDALLSRLDPSEVIQKSKNGNGLSSARKRLDTIKAEIRQIEREIETGDSAILNPDLTQKTKDRIIKKMETLESDLEAKREKLDTIQTEISLATQDERPLVEALTEMADVAVGAILGIEGRVRLTKVSDGDNGMVDIKTPEFSRIKPIGKDAQRDLRIRLKDAIRTIVSKIELDLEKMVFEVTLKNGVPLFDKGDDKPKSQSKQGRIKNPLKNFDDRFADLLDGMFLRWMASDLSSSRVKPKAQALMAQIDASPVYDYAIDDGDGDAEADADDPITLQQWAKIEKTKRKK